MTVSTTNTSDAYISDGATTTYAFTFQIISDNFGNPDPSTVEVLFNNNVQTSGITVLPNDDQESAPGGTITLVAGAQPGGTQILLRRNTPRTQDTTFPLASKLSTVALESALDKLVMIAQESQAAVDSAFGLANPLPGVSNLWPTPVAGGIPVWNDTANAIDYITPQQAHFVLVDNGVGAEPTMQPNSGGGGGGGGGVFGPATTTPLSIVLWNNATGTVVEDGPSLGNIGQVITSQGAGFPPIMADPALKGPGASTDHAVVLWNGTTGKVVKNGPTVPQYAGLPLLSGGSTGGNRNDPLFSAPPPNPFYLSPSPQRRTMRWQSLNQAAATLTAIGATALTAAGTITNQIINNVGKFQHAATSGVINTNAGWISPTIDETAYALNWTFYAHVYSGDTISNKRLWIGLVDSDPVATDTAVDGTLFRYSTSAGDTTFKAVVGDGVHFTVKDTGVAYTANTEYRLFIDGSVPGVVNFWINEVLVATITTTLPGALDGAGPCVRVRCLSASSRKIGVGHIIVETL